MITCCIQYRINPSKLDEFERYGRWWMALVRKYGGMHHGFFVSMADDDRVAMAQFTFPGISEYAIYIAATLTDLDCIDACAYGKETGCIVQMDRRFFRPISEHAIS